MIILFEQSSSTDPACTLVHNMMYCWQCLGSGFCQVACSPQKMGSSDTRCSVFKIGCFDMIKLRMIAHLTS